MSMVFCFAASAEFTAVVREVQANCYRLASYLIAQTVLQLPLMVVIALVSLLPSGFGIGDWNLGAFWEMEMILITMLWLYESLAQLLAVAAPHPAIATMGVTTFWLVAFLFGGSMVRKEDVPWPFRIYAYISPYGYASKAATRSEFIHSTFAGAERNLDGSYSCPGALSVGCFGITGAEVLESLSHIVYNLSPADELWKDLGIVFGIACVFKMSFVLTAYYKCSRGTTVESPPPEDPSDTGHGAP